MIDFAVLLAELAESVPLTAGGPEAGIAMVVETMEVDLPMEARLAADGSLLATFPRGRLATGFEPAHARLAARFGVRSD